MTPTSVPLPQAYRLLNHGPVVLVSSAHQNKRNVMAAAWNMPLDFDPPKVSVVIDKNTYTRELVDASGQFALNLPCRAQAEIVLAVGSDSGRDAAEDKFARFQLDTFAAATIEAPLLQGCVAWLECKVISEPHAQQHYDLFIGEVVAAWADARVFADGRWNFAGNDDLRTLHYIAGGAFFATGEPI